MTYFRHRGRFPSIATKKSKLDPDRIRWFTTSINYHQSNRHIEPVITSLVLLILSPKLGEGNRDFEQFLVTERAQVL